MTSNILVVNVLQALHGDALSVKFLGEDHKYHNIFIDGGFTRTYRATLREEILKILEADEEIDLFIITHTDQDHISGVLAIGVNLGELSVEFDDFRYRWGKAH
jgi:glyoxylase-like metal-dependent hydrolase (beta-lactamase superfamily II)